MAETSSAPSSGSVDLPLQLVVVIGGPIASGKSSLALSVARAVEQQGLEAATIDLDLIYEMLEHTRAHKSDPSIWTRARRIAGALTSGFLDDGINIVVAEGDFLDEPARDEFVSMLPVGIPIRFVTLTVQLATAFLRVERDPTRGISRDRGFLARHYDELAEAVRARSDDDLCLDTDELTLERATQSVVKWVSGSITSA
jgi:adenylylsulfate kinase-like enzyme